MKFMINIAAVLFISIAFAACQKANDPVSPNDINKTDISTTSVSGKDLSGGFEVTFKDYKNTDQAQTLRGTISFTFEKSTYSYYGQISTTADEPTTTFVQDKGTYTIEGNIIRLADDATKMMHAEWMPSLYLAGDYRYTQIGDVTTIEGNGRFGSIKITLKTR